MNSYTFSVWPGSQIKKDVPYKFYQKPIYNYKLECENNGNTLSEYVSLFDAANVSSQHVRNLIATFDELGTACLCVILIGPCSVGKGEGLVCVPIAFIAVAGMFVKIIL